MGKKTKLGFICIILLFFALSTFIAGMVFEEHKPKCFAATILFKHIAPTQYAIATNVGPYRYKLIPGIQYTLDEGDVIFHILDYGECE